MCGGAYMSDRLCCFPPGRTLVMSTSCSVEEVEAEESEEEVEGTRPSLKDIEGKTVMSSLMYKTARINTETTSGHTLLIRSKYSHNLADVRGRGQCLQ